MIIDAPVQLWYSAVMFETKFAVPWVKRANVAKRINVLHIAINHKYTLVINSPVMNSERTMIQTVANATVFVISAQLIRTNTRIVHAITWADLCNILITCE